MAVDLSFASGSETQPIARLTRSADETQYSETAFWPQRIVVQMAKYKLEDY